MDCENLKRRTKQFGLEVIKLVEALPKDETCRAKSSADFISKMGNVEEEADESGYWVEMLVDAQKLTPASAAPLIQEASELTAVAVSSINTAGQSGSRA